MVVHYRSDAEIALALIDELNQLRPDSAIGKQTDLTSAGFAEDLVGAAVDHWGQLDLLVNSASQFRPTPVGTITIDDMQSLFATNFQAPMLLTQAAYPHLQSAEGSVVNILDIYSSMVHRDHPVYSASKAALRMLTKSLAVDLAPNVRVNGISPGAILWPEGEAAISDEKKSSILQHIPLGRMGNPDQIAQAVVYLSSDNAKFVTGQILAMDGGRTL